MAKTAELSHQNIVMVDHAMLKRLIPVFYRARQPLFIHGTIGIGKSQMVGEAAQYIATDIEKRELVSWNKMVEKDKVDLLTNDKRVGEITLFVDERTSLKDTTDNKGIPLMGNEAGDYLKWQKTLIIKIAAKPNASVIFFKDEFNLALPQVMHAEYQWILDNGIDDIAFAPGVWTVAAGNTSDDGCNVTEMPAALRDRFSHVYLTPAPLEQWMEWAIAHDINSYILGFLQFKETGLHTFDSTGKDFVFATHRGYEKLNAVMKHLDPKDLDMLEIAAGAKIGAGLGHAFRKFVELEMNIKLEEYLKNPQKLKTIEQPDVLQAILTSAIEHYRTKPAILPQVAEFTRYIMVPLGGYLLRMLKLTNEKDFTKNIMKVPAWDDFILEKFGKYVLDR